MERPWVTRRLGRHADQLVGVSESVGPTVMRQLEPFTSQRPQHRSLQAALTANFMGVTSLVNESTTDMGSLYVPSLGQELVIQR